MRAPLLAVAALSVLTACDPAPSTSSDPTPEPTPEPTPPAPIFSNPYTLDDFTPALSGFTLALDPPAAQYRCAVTVTYTRDALGGFEPSDPGARGDLYVQLAAFYGAPTDPESAIERNSRLLLLENGAGEATAQATLDILPGTSLLLRALHTPMRAPEATLTDLDLSLTITDCDPDLFTPVHDAEADTLQSIDAPDPDAVYLVSDPETPGLWRYAPELDPAAIWGLAAVTDPLGRSWERAGDLLDIDWVSGSLGAALAVANRLPAIERVVVPNREYDFLQPNDPAQPLAPLLSDPAFKAAFGLDQTDFRFRMDLQGDVTIQGIGAATVHLGGDTLLQLSSPTLPTADGALGITLTSPLMDRGADTLAYPDGAFLDPPARGDIARLTSTIAGSVISGWMTSYEQGEIALVSAATADTLTLAGRTLDEPFGMRFVYPGSGNWLMGHGDYAALLADPNHQVPSYRYVHLPCRWDGEDACRDNITDYWFHSIRNHFEDAICSYELGLPDAPPLVANASDRDEHVVAQYEQCFAAAEAIEEPTRLTLTVYRPHSTTVDNLALRISSDGGNGPGSARFQGIQSPTFTGLSVLGPPAAPGAWSYGGLVVASSANATFEQLTAKRLVYVVSAHMTAGTRFSDVLADDNHHAIDHAVWAYDGRIERMFSQDGDTSLQSHPAFDLTFEDAIEINGGCPALRTHGGGLINVEVRDSTCTQSVNLQAQMVMDPQLYRFDDHVVRHGSFDGLPLGIGTGRDITVTDSVFQRLSGWGAGVRCRHGTATLENNVVTEVGSLRTGPGCVVQEL